jgi:IS1 family transposase
MYTPLDEAAKAIELLVEGCSVSTVERFTGLHHTTILSLLVLVGDKCERLLESKVQAIPVADVQCDEMWGYVGCKQKRNVTGDPLRGDAYCFVAIERNTKLVLTWHLGRRTARDAMAFTEKLEEATSGNFQLTTDGFQPYFDAIHTCLGTRVDYSQLIKTYAATTDEEHRYSPPQVVDVTVKPMWGSPDPERICTSHVERQNLSIRMGMRRMTRLTNAFSKKWANLKAAYAVWFAFYNFCRVHHTLRCTPAMAAGVADHIWSVEELVEAIA